MTSLSHDRVVDVFEAHGLRCVIALGGPMDRNYNGYVEAPAGVETSDGSLDVHGGVTWSDWRLPWEAECGDRWWLGFDTAHAGDAVPGLSSIGIETTGIFRDVDYVRDECIKLASQLAEKGQPS
jgi:hypothetical protein